MPAAMPAFLFCLSLASAPENIAEHERRTRDSNGWYVLVLREAYDAFVGIDSIECPMGFFAPCRFRPSISSWPSTCSRFSADRHRNR
jgi:hypothetical protein